MKTKTRHLPLALLLLLLLLLAAAFNACTYSRDPLQSEPRITLTVEPGRKILLNFAGQTDTTPVRIRSGHLDTTLIIGTDRTPARFYIADGEEMTVHGRITIFNCSNNGSGVIALDCSGDTLLRTLECHDNTLTDLNISGCSGLRILECYSNRLARLDLSGCPALSRLNCGDNRLTTLDLSRCPALVMIACINNSLTQLDVTMCRELAVLYCYRNKLAELHLRGCAWLAELSCGKNYLTTLDFAGCNSLQTAYCCENNFSYAATEDLYRSLPDRTVDEEPGHIFILNEDALPPGRTRAGNEGLATEKHWDVYFCSGEW